MNIYTVYWPKYTKRRHNSRKENEPSWAQTLGFTLQMTIERPHTRISLLNCYCHVGGLCYVVRVAKWSSKEIVQNISWDICTSASASHLRDYWLFSALVAFHIVLNPLKSREHSSKYTTTFNNLQLVQTLYLCVLRFVDCAP